jgi:purine-binding chemotaxis protein CheW
MRHDSTPAPIGSSDAAGASGPGSGAGTSGAGSGRDSRAGRARAGQNVCVFWLGGQRYALDAVLVREVVAVPGLLPVPMTPPWILGLCNLRGVALAVVDLGGVLDLKTPAAASSAAGTVVLVLRPGGMDVGVRIDRVEAVYRFDAARVEPGTALDEHPAVKGLLGFDSRGGFVATLLDEGRLATRLKELKFRKSGTGAATGFSGGQ